MYRKIRNDCSQAVHAALEQYFLGPPAKVEDFCIAGLGVRVSTFGTVLSRFLRAWHPLRVPSGGNFDLAIDVRHGQDIPIVRTILGDPYPHSYYESADGRFSLHYHPKIVT